MWKEWLVRGKFAGPSQSMRIEVPLTSSTITSENASEITPERQGQYKASNCEYESRYGESK